VRLRADRASVDETKRSSSASCRSVRAYRELDALGRRHVHLAAAVPLPELPARPHQQVVAGHPPGEAETFELEEVREGRQVDVLVGRIEGLRRFDAALVERLHPVAELRGAAVDVGSRLRDLELFRNPQYRATQVAEPVGVHACFRAAERPFQLAAEP